MNRYALLISPLAKSAYFKAYIDIAINELSWCLGIDDTEHQKISTLDFLYIRANEEQLFGLSRLSFVQGIFKREDENLEPLTIDNQFQLHEDFVCAAKFKGKTNELLTQCLINVAHKALLSNGDTISEKIKLLDPMCGRATTLLWAQRYSFKAKGIEQDKKALADIRQLVKKQCKLHRQKHQCREGFVGKANKQDNGKFIDFAFPDSSMRVISGDSAKADQLLKDEKFHLIVSDLPYGVQHFTTEKTRNPLAVIEQCVEGWINSLKPGGIIGLAFNSNQPKRDALSHVFTNEGLEQLDFSMPHQMSESIVRDVVLFKRI